MSPNQIVAWNLRYWRNELGLTQEQAAERLAPFVDQPWSKATFSAAEQSVAGKRVRQFSADDIIALALAFKLPIQSFFTPPAEAIVELNGRAVPREKVKELAHPMISPFLASQVHQLVEDELEALGQRVRAGITERLLREDTP